MPLNIFDVKEPIAINNRIMRYEYHGYKPEAHTNLNTTGEIRIQIINKDTIDHPVGSYLLIEGRLKKADGNAYANADKMPLANNGGMFLFDSIKRSYQKKLLKRHNIQVRQLLC
jgi:hypothetical protein